jgi:hypothetical protein
MIGGQFTQVAEQGVRFTSAAEMRQRLMNTAEIVMDEVKSGHK